MAASGPRTEEKPSDPYDISVLSLRTETKLLLSSLLNPPKVIPTENGLLRDWQGLAELMGVGGEHMPRLQQYDDPLQQLLKTWCANNGHNSTVKQLFGYLEKLDRYDVLDDSKEMIENDIKVYDSLTLNGDVSILDPESDGCILTSDDLRQREEGQKLVQYDAFVLYSDEDIHFASEVIEKMEKEKNLRFCVKDSLVAGLFQHEAIVKLIAERCNRLIVILSPAFFKSPYNKFFMNFAQNIGIDQRVRKIIPIILDRCEIPVELKFYHMLDFKRSGPLWNFWEKLYDSVRQLERENARATNLNRSVSHQVRPMTDNPLGGPINLPKTCGTLKPKREGCVTFSSMVNLAHEPQPSPDPSLSAVSIDLKKSKTSWVKKFTAKKKFWRKSKKQKVATTS